MKRLVCIAMALVMLLIVPVGAHAQAATPDEAEQYLYLDAFKQAYPDYGTPHYISRYRELVQHRSDQAQTPDWVLVQASVDVTPDSVYGLYYDRIIVHSLAEPFVTAFAVYYPAENRWQFIGEALAENPDVRTACNRLNIGRLLGDIDGDGVVSIIDATVIQMCLANLQPFEDDVRQTTYGAVLNPYGTTVRYLSDYDRDGERSIMDVTKIQMVLAHLEEY